MRVQPRVGREKTEDQNRRGIEHTRCRERVGRKSCEVNAPRDPASTRPESSAPIISGKGSRSADRFRVAAVLVDQSRNAACCIVFIATIATVLPLRSQRFERRVFLHHHGSVMVVASRSMPARRTSAANRVRARGNRGDVRRADVERAADDGGAMTGPL